MKTKTFVWITFALTLVVYGTMVFWSLPILTKDLGGLLLFDLRFEGYSFQEARAFLVSLSPEGTQFYLTEQRVLDTAFPVLEAMSLGGAIFLLLPVDMGLKRVFIALLVLPGSIFDLLENAAVAALLRAGANGVTPDMVAQASYFTQMKFAFVTVSILVLLFVLAVWFLRRHRG